MKTLLMFIIIAVAGSAQTAKVIALDKVDSEKAARLREVVKKAEKDLRDFDSQVEKKYTKSRVSVGTITYNNSYKTSISGPYFPFLAGWEGGFEYTDDWKFLVPKHNTSGVVCSYKAGVDWTVVVP